MDTSTAIAAVDTLGRRITERRRRTVQEKIKIVAESRVPGRSVAEVARQYELNANQVFAWRRQADQGVLGQPTSRAGVRLLSVQVAEADGQASGSQSTATVASEGRIEVTLAGGVHIAIFGAVASAHLEQVLCVLRR